jgi:dsRNA-specific ribonuclease
MNSSTNNEIFYGSRGDDFTMLLVKLLKKGRLQTKYINLLLSKNSIKEYANAFTAKSADPINNYERFEQIGDVTANKFIVWYAYRRFPQLDCTQGVKVVARLRINYGAKAFFGRLGEELGFWPFISAQIDGNERNTYYRSRNKQDLLEDCVESFIGCTEYLLDKAFRPGVGYAIVYDLLETVFNDIDMSLKYEDLYDSKTRLKETFDVFKTTIGTWRFLEHKIEGQDGYTNTVSQIFQIPPGIKPIARRSGDQCHPEHGWILIGEGVGCKKSDAQQRAAEAGITFLRHNGIYKPPPPEYHMFQTN